MARLPKPGGDQGTWGDILNEYLLVSHGEDGTLRPDSVSGAALKNNSVSTLKIQAKAVSPGKIDAVNTPVPDDVLSFDGTSFSWVAQSSGTNDHGTLTGLDQDHHAQYLNTTRGDARYYTQTQIDAATSTKANSADVYTKIEADTLLSGKANTTHSHAIADTTGLQTALDGKAAATHDHSIANITNLQATLDAKISETEKGALNGVASLGADGKVPSSQLPASTDAVSSVAGKTGDVLLTKADVGIGNVDNTSDANKPVSTATQTALDTKANVANVVLLAGAQTVTGPKDFSGGLTIDGMSVIATNDARLTDERVPLNDSVTDIKVSATANIAQSKIAGLSDDLAAKYTKPVSGIPESDLDTAVQAKLNPSGNYITGNGVAVVTVGVSAPTAPSIGDIWIST